MDDDMVSATFSAFRTSYEDPRIRICYSLPV